MIINAKHAYNISKDIIPKSEYGQCLYAIEELILKAALEGYTQCVYKVSNESSDVLNNIADTLTQNGYIWAYQYGPSVLLISWADPLPDIITDNDMEGYDYLLDVGPEEKDSKQNDNNESDNLFGRLGSMLKPH